MKYIITKAGEIYDIDDLYVCENLNGKPYGVKDSSWVIYQESIIKQADTIEELCDCYSFGTETTRDYFVAQSWKKADKSRHIYGCILTDTGIIRIAELNEEEGLELL